MFLGGSEWVAHMVHLAILLLLLHVENMWSQCVSAPSEKVCISLRVCSLPYFSPLSTPPLIPPRLFSLIFSACRSRRLFSRKDATSVHRAVTFRPSFLQNESIGRPLYDERRNFPAGTDDIFRENIGNFIPALKINSSPSLFREKKRISFLFNKGELISNLF